MRKGSLRSVLLSSAAATMLIASAGTANAIEYNFGSVQVFFDTTLSAGVSVKASSVNNAFLPTGNGGPLDTRSLSSDGIAADGGTFDDPNLAATAPGTAFIPLAGPDNFGGSINTDDGRLNFDRGDLIGNTYKMTNDIQAKWENYTFFARVNSYYDAVLASDGSYDRSELIDGEADAARDIRLLDFYLAADYDVGDLPLNIRVGKQVISWGESTFLLNGVNTFNPIDVSAFRRPGSEIKEALVPLWAVDASIGLPYNLSLEAFYQLEWDDFQLDRPGTPFSTLDVGNVGSGLGGNVNATSFTSGGRFAGTFRRNCDGAAFHGAFFSGLLDQRFDSAADCASSPYVDFRTPIPIGQNEQVRLDLGDLGTITRAKDEEPSDSGQYGVAARWYSEELNNTEFGFYFTNTHSRLPFASQRLKAGVVGIATTGFSSNNTTRINANPRSGCGTFLVTGEFGDPRNNSTTGISIDINAANGNILDPDGFLSDATAASTGLLDDAEAFIGANGVPAALATFQAVRADIAANGPSLLLMSMVNCYLAPSQTNAGGQLVTGAETLAYNFQSELFFEYPEDIRMYGWSFNTTLGTWGVQGDFTFRPNQPVALDSDQTTITAAAAGCAFVAGGDVLSVNFEPLNTQAQGTCDSAGFVGETVHGFTRTDIYTAQVGTTATFTNSNPLIGLTGADLGVLVTEVGMIYASDTPEGVGTTERWANVCTNGGTDLPLGGLLSLDTKAGCRPTSTSWGYVLLGQLQYNSVFGSGFALQPTVAFSHGVKGNSPAPLSNYREGAKSVSLQLNGSYLGNWRGGVSYTNFFGSEKFAGNTDQDFVSMNVSYSF